MLIKLAFWVLILALVGFYAVACDDNAKSAIKSFIRKPLARWSRVDSEGNVVLPFSPSTRRAIRFTLALLAMPLLVAAAIVIYVMGPGLWFVFLIGYFVVMAALASLNRLRNTASRKTEHDGRGEG